MPVEVRYEGVPEDDHGLTAEAERLLAHADLRTMELSLVFCDDPFIRALNHQWRQKDEATDVLSFPMESDELLGDLVLSVPTATRQAVRDLPTELRVLLVHGFLHLLGYDHLEPDDAAEMREAEARLLGEVLGVDPVGLVERAGD